MKNKKKNAHYAFLIRLVEECAAVFKVALWVFCVCYVGYWFFKMLGEVAQTKDSSVVAAFAIIIEKLSIDRIVLVVLNMITGTGWWWAKRRNKRLTKKLGDKRHELEKPDLVNDRSGLDEFGKLKGE